MGASDVALGLRLVAAEAQAVQAIHQVVRGNRQRERSSSQHHPNREEESLWVRNTVTAA
jgi:hypothetical protein